MTSQSARGIAVHAARVRSVGGVLMAQVAVS